MLENGTEGRVNDMRLIDGKRLVKETVPQYKELMGTDIGHGIGMMLAEISAAPTIDAVPVVRCKDCALQGKLDCPMDEWVKPDNNGFCHHGKRKDGAPHEA